MPATRETDALHGGLLRLRTASGTVVGAGFLIDTDLACTCAHVVARALGLPGTPDEAPAGSVRLELPLLRAGVPTVRGTVVAWQRIGEDESGDVALLRLDAGVDGARPVPLVDGTKVWDHPFRVFGFPKGADHGVWTSGTLRDVQGTGWIQMDSGGSARRVTPGFSGSPVWDEQQGGVVGMTVAAERGASATTAYLIPSALLVDERLLARRSPFRGLLAFTEEDADLFHGREEDTARLRAAVRRQAVTLVAGPSGSGKSSLVRAGLVPQLRAEGHTVTELRPLGGEHPELALARVLVPVLEPSPGETERLEKGLDLARRLGLRDEEEDGGGGGVAEESRAHRGGRAVAGQLGARVLARGGTAGHLFFLDQFEEYAAVAPGAARRLLALLRAMTTATETTTPPGGPALRVVATVRPETLDALVTAETARLLGESTCFVAPLGREDLTRAVTGPVEAVPGLWFEPGLPRRIVDDAAEEPGRMPLVEFTLERLWELRERAMLTHAAYDRLGGVAGALAGYADEALDATLRPGEEPLARRLFSQLASPDGDGRAGFTRRPARTADLDAPLLALARRLGPTRLLVLDHTGDGGGTPAGAEIVELAHEALVRQWPRLRGWLTESRDFRAWQDQLRRDMARWREGGEEDGGLLRGVALATAVEQASRHADDVSPDERRFVRQSERLRRRGVRRWRTATAGIAVLALLASGLALSAWRSRQDVLGELRRQASQTLAQAADRRATTDPAAALQLALAAYRASPTPDAYGTLIEQYARDRSLTGVVPHAYSGRLTSVDASDDGRTVVVWSSKGGKQRLSVWKGPFTGADAEQGRPRRTWRLAGVPADAVASAISPDGHTFAVTGKDGGVRLWDLTHQGAAPRVLARGDARADGSGGAGDEEHEPLSLEFSGDGSRLLMLDGFVKDGAQQGAAVAKLKRPLKAWSVASGHSLTVGAHLPESWTIYDAYFAADPDQLVVSLGEGTQRYALVDARSGRRLREFAGEGVLIARHGAAVVTDRSKEAGEKRLRVMRTGEKDDGRPVPLPGGISSNGAAGSYGFQNTAASGSAHYAHVTLTDLRNGRAFRSTLPTGEDDLWVNTVTVLPPTGSAKAPSLLVAEGGALLVARAEPVTPQVVRESDGGVPDEDYRTEAATPDGAYTVELSDTHVRVRRRDGEVTARVTLPKESSGLPWQAVTTTDGSRVVVWSGDDVAAYSLPGLDEKTPLRAEGHPGPFGAGVVPLGGSEMAVISGRSAVRVDAADGRRLGAPVDIAPGGKEERLPDPDSGVAPRPGHPGRIAVGSDAGGVEVWDMRRGRRVARLDTAPLSRTASRALTFSPDGERLATVDADGYVRVRDVDTGKREGRVLSTGGVERVVGFGTRGGSGSGDILVTADQTSSDSGLTVWERGNGRRLARLTPLAPYTSLAVLHSDRLTLHSPGLSQTVDLDGDRVFAHVCASVSRGYTSDERELLPPGAPEGPPCG